MTAKHSWSKRQRFYAITIPLYLVLVVVSLIVYDRVPWMIVGAAALGAGLALAAFESWQSRHKQKG